MSSACAACGKELKDVSGNAGVMFCADCQRKGALEAKAKSKIHLAPESNPVDQRPKQSGPGTSGIGQAISDKPRLGPYVILGEIGRGGMGRVYKAMHRTLRQIRALKVLNRDESRNPKVVARFQREARIVAK